MTSNELQESDELQEGDKRRVRAKLVSVSGGAVGIVADSDVRATHREPSFTGLSRQTIGDRFSSATSIPQSGPTVPTTSSPSIQTARPINLQESEQESDKRTIKYSQEGDRMRSPYGKQEGDQEGDAFGDTRAGREGRLVDERRSAKNPFPKQEGDQEGDRIGKPKPIKTGFKGPEQGQESEED